MTYKMRKSTMQKCLRKCV